MAAPTFCRCGCGDSRGRRFLSEAGPTIPEKGPDFAFGKKGVEVELAPYYSKR